MILWLAVGIGIYIFGVFKFEWSLYEMAAMFIVIAIGTAIVQTPKTPVAIRTYSQAVEKNGFLFISGQLPINPEKQKMSSDITEQAKQSLKNIQSILEESGMTLENVIKNTVFVTSLEQAAAINEAVANEIESQDCEVLPVPFDLTRADEIPAVMEKIYNHFGRIDVLLNNAGTNIFQSPEEVTEEAWDKIININLKSAFFAAQAAGKYMKENQQGKIINMSSQMAFVGYYDRTVYSASKAGVSQLTKSLAIEWASDNINVNAIAPTFIETSMTKQLLNDESFRKEVLGRIPLGRLSKTQDLLGAVLYLASPASDMVTGQTMIVDGGWTAW